MSVSGAERAERLLQLEWDASLLAEAGDYDGAYRKLLAARPLFDMTPDQEKEGLSLRRRDIENLMKQYQKLAQQARLGSGIQQQKIEYVRPTCE